MHQVLKKQEQVMPEGRATIRSVARRRGIIIPWGEARVRLRGIKLQPEVIEQKNLVVKVGRRGIATAISQRNSPVVDRIQLGDCKIAGVVSKVENPPDLSDTGMLHEIRTLTGAPGATFDVDSVSYPDSVTKLAPSGSPGVLTAGAVSIFTDATADFASAGVTPEDVVTMTIDGETFTLGVNEVLSATQLEVANPFQIVNGAVSYIVETPGSQVRFTKIVSGDNFPEADFGPLVICHEAGLMFDNGSLFNRITIVGNDNDTGLVLRPEDVDGTSIDIHFEWTITF